MLVDDSRLKILSSTQTRTHGRVFLKPWALPACPLPSIFHIPFLIIWYILSKCWLYLQTRVSMKN